MRLSVGAALAIAFVLAQPVHAETAALVGDPARGAKIYERCGGCHSLDRNRTGPRHCGLFGRKAGSVPGFDYSRAMKQSGIVWTAETLNTFLENPRKVVPGTKMTYAGIKNAQERADVIAYLKQANADPSECPQK